MSGEDKPQQPKKSAAQELFDLNTIKEAEQLLKGKYPQIVEGYLEDTDQYIKNLEDAYLLGEWLKIVQNAHPLKASSEAMGVITLHKGARILEHAARKAIQDGGTPENAQMIISKLRETFKKVKPLMLTRIRQSSA